VTDEHDVGDVSFWQIRNVRLAVAAGVLLGAGLLAAWFQVGEPMPDLLFLGAIVVGGFTFVPEALRGLARIELGVGTLMSIAAIGAVLLGEFAEAASLAFLFSIAEGLESYSLTQAHRGLRALLGLVPESATVVRDGEVVAVPAADLRIGDRIRLRPGDRLATDAVVVSGRSSIDVSAITGESQRVEVGAGSSVFAGSVNGAGALDLEATATAVDNSLSRIVEIVEGAQRRKGRRQRLADRIARPLVPGIIVVALAAAIVGSLLDDPAVWIPRALVILVAAAPCAFAIAVPVTVVAAVGSATRSGLLIKGGAALEALGRVRTIALDKTGTLTRNRPQVVTAEASDGVDRSRLLAVAAALESHSEHPLAPAILAAAPGIPAASEVEAVAGQGLVGLVEGRPARLGKPGFVEADGLEDQVMASQTAGATTVLVESDGRTIGVIAVRDELRQEAAETVAALRRLGMDVVMLTGDNRSTASALARQAGIERVEAELRPEDKARLVDGLRDHGVVAMVGDGINDAPALATADVGIAMGAMGTDVAIETADVAMMGDDLRHLPAALGHARRAVGIMNQNLVLSGAILVTLIPLAAFGVLGLAAVVAIHEVAELIVIGNGLRAGRAPDALPDRSTA
jgi:cation-transporting ATPase G